MMNYRVIQMNESILDKKIKTWEDRLLDLGKRNKMISFRESKRATLKILKPSFEELYQQIVVDEKELTFQKAIDRDSDVRVYSILNLLDKLSCPMEVNIGDIRAEGSLPEIKKTLKHLRSKDRLALDEQGTNILYLVFGFIEWREKGSRSTDSWVKSPLILVPVTLTLPSLNAQYSLQKHEDEVVVNPTLAYLFERDYGISLPEFDSDKDTLESFMQKMETLVDERGWRIVRECSMGLVSFLKISMYNDLIRNEDQLKTNPIIRAFAGERNEVNTVDGDSFKFDHDACRAIDSFQVLDADSSQQDAIALSQKGVSFVMQGPPGTGKSQTIANIIGQALADGKKILFVSEKMAALDVVYRRLSDVHLADFCLSLHSHKANKKEILDQLSANLSLQRIRVKDEEIAKLTRLDMIREQLKAYVHDIHQTIMPLEMSLYEVYGAILELGSLPDIEIHLSGVDQLTKDDVNRLALMIMNLDKAQGVLGPQWYKNPWQGILGSYLEVSQKRELQNKLQDAVRILSVLEECKLVDKSLADIISIDTLDAFWELYEHAVHCSSIPNGWFHRPTEQEEHLVRALCKRKHTIDSLTQELTNRYGHEFFDMSGQSVAMELTASMKKYCDVLRNNEEYDTAFELMEDDLQRVVLLDETCHLLIDALNVFSAEYNLLIQFDFDSVDAVLTVCKMLLEKRKLTYWYFSESKSEHLLQYVTDLRNKLHSFVDQKERLCKRYSDGILEHKGFDQILSQLVLAETDLLPLISDNRLTYSTLCDISSFEPDVLQNVETALNHTSFAGMRQTFGMPRPTTLREVKTQISVIEKAQQNKIVSSWHSASTRIAAKQLLQEVLGKTNELAEAKKKLEKFFKQVGIVIDVDTMSDSDVAKLQQADKVVPEAVSIVRCCKNDSAYNLLDTIDQNSENFSALVQKISDLRTEYRIIDSLDNFELLVALQTYRDAVVLSAPCSSWANSKVEAFAILDQVMEIANKLKTQRNQILETCEETVFALDYTGILNRFKAEYTSFFKIFKSSYREDTKQIRLVFKEVRKKISDDEIIALLHALRQYDEDLKEYRAFSAQIAKLFGIQEYDIGFDWEAIKKRLDAFDAVGHLFQDDYATYRFIVENCWNSIYDVLVSYDELNTWFVDNEVAKKYYANLYLGFETDTAKIRDALCHARDICTIFDSADRYLEYMLSGIVSQDVENAKKYAADIVTVRAWLISQANKINEYTGITYDESFDEWNEILSQLETFNDIVSEIGEDPGYDLVKKYSTQRTLVDDYLVVLKQVTQIAEYAQSVHHVATNQADINEMDVKRLIEDIRIIITNVALLQSVYTKLSIYCPEGYSALNVDEIKNDLNAILLYQYTRDNLSSIEDEAREKLGNEYSGVSTDWDSVISNIVFSGKVIQLLSGNISAELKAAFVSGVPLYSDAQVAELCNYLSTAREVETVFPTLGTERELASKIKVLEEMCAALNSAIRTKCVITSTAYVQCSYSGIIADLEKLARVQETKMAFDGDLKKVEKILPKLTFDSSTDWDYIAEIFNHLRQVKRVISMSSIDSEIMQFVTNGIPGITVTAYKVQIEKLVGNKQLISSLTGLFANKAILEAYNLSKLTRRFRNCNEQFSTIDAWIDLRDCKKACVDNGLEDFIVTAEDTYYPAGMLKDVFMKSFYYEWFEKVCTRIESVSSFRVRTQESRVDTFRELDSHQLPVDQMRIREKLIREMPSRHNYGRATDEMSILLHELNKKRKIMPLRKLFRTIPNLLLKLKPCLMMSPLSVSYFLEAETYRFDMVIFDEASQIFPQDAIGAIFRGKQVIIAGDSKQLPPTNFFSASTSNDVDFDYEDDEEEEVNFDSILEEASNSLPNRSLLWHYRSRFEELISFSNQQIYQNNLITFPSSTIHAKDTGVEYVHVQNGVYENRCNRAEAQEIVRMVAEHIRKYPDRSLGVIAFSESQQSVIEEEINKFRTSNPFYERFFDEDKDEPFFVKNLENVQGDERDTIMFSICYAKNAQGRMYMRFGPLGHQGGERRLNVAITRAKYNVKLVGSILPEDIDLSKTHSEGVRMLRTYISFAMNGSSALPKMEKKNSLYDVDTFSEQVGKFLTSRGCSVKMNVGSSDYTIDIAVEHPKKPGRYIAGIECDGSSYYIARTVRDREHLRTAVLEQMGWKMYRVWSTEWIRNPEAEKERLMTFIQDALIHHGEVVSETSTSDAVEEIVGTEVIKSDRTVKPQNSTDPYNLPLYEEGKWWDRPNHRRNDNLSNIADMVLAVVKVEQPIHMELLYKRVSQGFTTGKVTQGVRETIDIAIREYMKDEVVIEDQFIRLASLTAVQARRSRLGDPNRTIEYISIPEIAAAMEKVLVGAYGMERSVLCSEAAKIFGFERTGAKIKQRTNEAVDYLIRIGKVSAYDDKVQLLEV